MTDKNSPNPKQQYGDLKVPLQLVPPAAKIYIALGLREGVFKYGAWNYRSTDIELMTYVGAIQRHIDAIVDGEWYDNEPVINAAGEVLNVPPKPHLAGLMASAAILADSYERSAVIDNRPIAGPCSYLLRKYLRCPNETEATEAAPESQPKSEMPNLREGPYSAEVKLGDPQRPRFCNPQF